MFEENIDKPKLWLKCVGENFIIWQNRKEKLETFFKYLSSVDNLP